MKQNFADTQKSFNKTAKIDKKGNTSKDFKIGRRRKKLETRLKEDAYDHNLKQLNSNKIKEFDDYKKKLLNYSHFTPVY